MSAQTYSQLELSDSSRNRSYRHRKVAQRKTRSENSHHVHQNSRNDTHTQQRKTNGVQRIQNKTHTQRMKTKPKQKQKGKMQDTGAAAQCRLVGRYRFFFFFFFFLQPFLLPLLRPAPPRPFSSTSPSEHVSSALSRNEPGAVT